MSKPCISVVMAVYNIGQQNILDESIGSILYQDMEDWELLICDDASTDQTPAWLQRWVERDDRIRIFRNKKNLKAAGARNRCIQEAKGEFIAIMDADDMCSENRLRIQKEFLDAHHEIAFVGLKGMCFHNVPGDLDKGYWFCRNPLPKDFLMTLPFVHGSLMFRRAALTAMNGYDAKKTALRSEDYDLLLRMYSSGMYGVNIDEAVYYIRENQNTFRRRKYRYRFPEALVKVRGFYRLKLMPKGLLYAFKPLVIGLIPVNVLERLKQQYYKDG